MAPAQSKKKRKHAVQLDAAEDLSPHYLRTAPTASLVCCKGPQNSLGLREVHTSTGDLTNSAAGNSQDYPEPTGAHAKGWTSKITCTEIDAPDKNVIVYKQPHPNNNMINQKVPEASGVEAATPLKQPSDMDQEFKEEIKDNKKTVLESLGQDGMLARGATDPFPRQFEDSSLAPNSPRGGAKRLLDEHDLQTFIQQSIDSRNLGSDTFSTGDLQRILKFRTVPFSSMPKNPVKIGEASFSEVFLANGNVHKVIPFNEHYGIEAFCKEVFVLDTLKEERGMCRIVDGFLVRGKYSKEYIRAWKSYGSASENIDPSEHKQSQVFGVIVMNDCGEDLEKYQFKDCSEVLNFISQLLSAICTLETKYRFEHRDLHWGNIMVKDSEIFLIDFNFARLETTKIVYTDLNREPWLFEGDPSVDLQFDVYKRMKMSCRSDWAPFNAKSNLLWVVYLLDKLHLKIRTLQVSGDKFKTTRIVQILETEAKRCNNTQDLLGWFENHILNK